MKRDFRRLLLCLSHMEQGHHEVRCFPGRSFPRVTEAQLALHTPVRPPQLYQPSPTERKQASLVPGWQGIALGPFSLLGLMPSDNFTSLLYNQNRKGSNQQSPTLPEQNFNYQ